MDNLLKHADLDNLPPVHQWNPDFCGDMDLVIKADGSWWHHGSPIGRERMVKLFSTILRKDGDDYYLVTPVEKLRIQVERAPFLVVSLQVVNEKGQQKLVFKDTLGQNVTVDEEHPIWVEDHDGEPQPMVLMRDNLPALINRAVFYELVELAEHKQHQQREHLVVASAGTTFDLGPCD